jgi:hypothetical protein
MRAVVALGRSLGEELVRCRGHKDGEHQARGGFHEEGWGDVLPGGRGVQKLPKASRNGLWPSPKRQLGHAPLPPRPFGWVGSNVCGHC